MRRLALLRTLMVAGAFEAAFLFAGQSHAADMAVKAPPAPGCTQAVDGINGKAGAFAGSLANDSIYGALGAISLPLGCEFGVQLDGIAASYDGSGLNIGAAHLFWRNPSEGLIGAYGDYAQWDRFGGVHVAHVGPEGERYFGQWTLQGLAGVEFGNNTSVTVGPVMQNFNIPDRFFDEVNLAYYVQDNLKVYAGHRYLGGKNGAAFGGEWGIPLQGGIMAALFAEGRVGENNDHGVWGGLRFYIGQKDKSLIRRQREDDPTEWDTDTFFGATNNSTASPGPPSSPPPCEDCG